MLIGKKMQDAMNEQVKNELYSANLYLAMAIHFENEGLMVFADWFYKQAKEEEEHAMKFIKYITETGGKAIVPEIPKPKNEFNSAEEITQMALEHEMKVTEMINKLVELAKSENDNSALQFLQWFVAEQVEEVANADQLLKIVQRAGEKNLLQAQNFITRGEE